MTVFNHKPLVWERNPDLDPLMTFEEFNFLPHELGRRGDSFKLVWYLDPKVNPLEEKVWALSCYRQGMENLKIKDMGHIMPEIDVEINPDVNSFTFDVDNCYPAFWELDTYNVYQLDPEYTTRAKQWLVKFSPKYKTVTKWEWAGTISPVFEIVTNPALPKFNYDIDYHIPLHDMCYEHVWYLDNALSKEKIWAMKITPSAEITGVKEMGEIIPVLENLDVIFISYNEPNAEENWQHVLEKAPHAKRVNGVKGIFQAHRAAAKLSTTDMFYVVDGDAYLVDNWTFDFQPGIFDRDCAYVWSSRNPVNGLTYQNGGVKIFSKKLLLKVKRWKTLDMFTGIMPKIKAQEEISCITTFNTDEFSTWRSAFRECVKLYTINQMSKLNTWMTKGKRKPFGEYAILGANAGYQYAKEHAGNTNALSKINDYDWLQDQFNRSTIKNAELTPN
jgi:hypothetical protein